MHVLALEIGQILVVETGKIGILTLRGDAIGEKRRKLIFHN